MQDVHADRAIKLMKEALHELRMAEDHYGGLVIEIAALKSALKLLKQTVNNEG